MHGHVARLRGSNDIAWVTPHQVPAGVTRTWRVSRREPTSQKPLPTATARIRVHTSLRKGPSKFCDHLASRLLGVHGCSSAHSCLGHSPETAIRIRVSGAVTTMMMYMLFSVASLQQACSKHVDHQVRGL